MTPFSVSFTTDQTPPCSQSSAGSRPLSDLISLHPLLLRVLQTRWPSSDPLCTSNRCSLQPASPWGVAHAPLSSWPTLGYISTFGSQFMRVLLRVTFLVTRSKQLHRHPRIFSQDPLFLFCGLVTIGSYALLVWYLFDLVDLVGGIWLCFVPCCALQCSICQASLNMDQLDAEPMGWISEWINWWFNYYGIFHKKKIISVWQWILTRLIGVIISKTYNIKSLRCIPKTNTMLHVYYISLF